MIVQQNGGTPSRRYTKKGFHNDPQETSNQKEAQNLS